MEENIPFFTGTVIRVGSQSDERFEVLEQVITYPVAALTRPWGNRRFNIVNLVGSTKPIPLRAVVALCFIRRLLVGNRFSSTYYLSYGR